MNHLLQNLRRGALLALMACLGACVAEPHDGYYDAGHHRYYHDHAWHDCGVHDGFCQ